MAVPPAVLTDLKQFLHRGPSLMVATRDEHMAPELVRAAGARLGDDGLLRVVLPLPEARRSAWNLETTRVVALSASLPTTYRSMQVKGDDARAVVWPEQVEVARLHLAALRQELLQVGMPLEVSSAIISQHRFSTFAFTPLELFEQTPGPQSGLPLVR